jgi:dihydrofolate synthase / folylpolyglutamate synthase
MTWSLEDAEAHLLSLELFGMRFGLERMRRLLTALGSPQNAFAAIHVVGTNGKSSTVRFTAALLEAHGVRAGAFLSPHLTSFAERVRIGDADLEPAAFGAAVQRAAAAAAKVDRTLPDGERVTQFELVTAAAFDELARRGVEVGVIEAGLGGRHDATNTISAPVVLLTNVGLEHTDVLGETRAAIAAEKLAVAGPDAVVVLPDDEFAELVPGEVRIGGAAEAVEAFLGERVPLAEAPLPGRLELRPGEVRDGAHTPEAVDWLLERLPDRGGYVVVASILRDKDAAGILDRLRRAGETLVATSSSSPRALSADDVSALAKPRFSTVETVADPHRALGRARELGRPVLVTGSLYLLADLAGDQ